MNISAERTSVNVKLSVPASSVEIEIMEGLGSKPIKVENLPLPFLSRSYRITPFTNLSPTLTKVTSKNSAIPGQVELAAESWLQVTIKKKEKIFTFFLYLIQSLPLGCDRDFSCIVGKPLAKERLLWPLMNG